MTFNQITEMQINTTWQNRLAQEPLKNKIREIEWQIRRKTFSPLLHKLGVTQ